MCLIDQMRERHVEEKNRGECSAPFRGAKEYELIERKDTFSVR